MRDPKRIDGVIEELKTLWKRYPDLRLGQLIVNSSGLIDPFFIEDDKLMENMGILLKNEQ